MRAAAGLFLLLLGLCGSVAQAEGGGLSQSFQKTPVRVAAEESTERSTKFDIWAEVRALRDMVVKLKVELKSLETRLRDSESQVEDLKEELTITKVHVELLQRQNTAQATELMSLGTRLTATESKTSDLEKENTAQATELTSLGTRLTATESKTSDIEKENGDLQSRLSGSESELLVSKSRIDQLEREIADKPKVAFYTALTDAGTVGPFDAMTKLKFIKVFTNIGNGYNPATGIFAAPVKGIYYFQFTVFYHVAGTMGIHVFKNNQKIMYNSNIWKEEGYRYITNSVVLELMAGDEIHLALPASYALYDNKGNYSTFSGFLVSPL